MAGFFGHFDYTKPGPGIGKNAPQKRSFFAFWELFGRKFWQLITVNLLYVLVSLPVLTMGMANAGLTYVTRNMSREKHAFIAADFFDTIRKNWKRALPIGIFNLFLLALILSDAFWYFTGTGTSRTLMAYLLTGMMIVCYIVFTIMKYYLYLLMVTFRFKFRQLYKNCAILVLAGLKTNLFISFILLLCYALAALLLLFMGGLWFVGAFILVLIYILIFPAFRSFLIQFFIFPVVKKYIIDPYYKEHPNEDVRERRSLGIETPKHKPTAEPVFTDRDTADSAAAGGGAKASPRPAIPPSRFASRDDDADDDI